MQRVINYENSLFYETGNVPMDTIKDWNESLMGKEKP